MIKIAYDADAPSAWCPHGKINALHAFDGVNMPAELVVRVVVATLAHEVKIELTQEKGKSVGVV